MTMLLSDGKYEFIYPLFTESSSKLRLNFMAPCSNDEGKARTLNVSIEKVTLLMAQEVTDFLAQNKSSHWKHRNEPY